MNKYLSPHTLILQKDSERVLIYQCLLKQGVLTDYDALILLLNCLSGVSQDEMQKTICFKDLSCFSLSECLLDNPNGICNDTEIELETGTFNQFLQLLSKLDLLVGDNTYQNKSGKQKSLFDNEHIGNFHQQIGKHLLKKRGDAEKWWIEQKFKKDLSEPGETPYKWVQLRFLEKFFDKDLAGQEWLDFGCGIGYYSHFFSERNATVTGVDPSQLYIDIANNRFSKNANVQFLTGKFESVQDFEILKNQKYDCIFMSDVFLYYYESYQKMELTAVDLLKGLKQKLLPDGRIYILDPHGCFHLHPWMGNDSPYLIVTEYMNRKYRVTPTLEEVSKTVEDAGLVIRKIRELCAAPSSINTQSRNVAEEYPLWWFFELSRL